MSEALATLWQSLVDGRPLDAAVAPLLAGLVATVAVAMLLETVVLLALHRRTGDGVPPRTLLPTIAAGGCLMGALHAALAGAPIGWLLLLLSAAGAAHALDLWRRWPRPPLTLGR